MPDYLFVYGTLEPGLAPPEVEHLVARMQSVGTGTVAGTLYDLGSYPGAVLDVLSERRIEGMVFAVPDDRGFWSGLDAYEEYDPGAPDSSQFVRVRDVVELASGAPLECWIYVYNRSVEGAPIVVSGAWQKHDQAVRTPRDREKG